ncbi:glycogen debranching protein [Shivajiella indica]|uniref:Glycogen debranching protein n=1 Tax=Shivajiella indica TaxID=872115 RepID=A0ABW5B6E2_9BACT
MRKIYFLNLFFILLVSACRKESVDSDFTSFIQDVKGLSGKPDYLSSPFVTAGDRVYMVGHQDGSFPDLGWHVPGEMGGIWNHPIKLMDGFTAALMTKEGAFCLDKADEFINLPFANLQEFKNSVPGIHIQRFQFVPEGQEGMVIEFLFTNTDKSKKSFEFEFTGHTELMPVWLGEEAGMIDHIDQLFYDDSRNAWRGEDDGNDWYVLFGSDQKAQKSEDTSIICNYTPQGNGKTGRLTYELTLPENGSTSIRIFIAGSYLNQNEVEKNFDLLVNQAENFLQEKRKHYEQIASMARLSIDDKELQTAFEWVKYNTEWLVREVPEIGRGLGAGMPDYPWWFGVDNEYTLKGAIATGRKDLVYQTIELIHNLSKANKNGRIIHEVSTNGIIFNPGNINETPQFASLIWWVYQWTGDKEFLSKYYPTIMEGLKWLMEENDKDNNLFPDGYGMMEIHGLESEMIDVAAYTQKAFEDAGKMALVMGDQELSESYQQKAEWLKEKINNDFWVEEFNSFADFIGTTSEALHLIDAAIIRADTLNKPWAVEELKTTKKKLSTYPENQKQGFVIFHNWVVNTPMEMKIADPEKAIKALDKANRFVNPFGVFVTGIDRDQSSENDDGSFSGSKVFSYTGAVMTLPTGVQAIAENNYGRPDEALEYLKRMTRSFSFALPGSIYEVSPDYGMMTQAWNLYAYAVPIITQFFGIQPEAYSKVIHIQPMLPKSWQNSKLENVHVGDNIIDLSYANSEAGFTAQINQIRDDWKIHFKIPKKGFTQASINGNIVEFGEDDWIEIFLNEKSNKVELIK